MGAPIRVLLGAALEDTVEASFASLEARAIKAGQVIREAMGGSGKSGYAKMADEAEAFGAKAEAASQKAGRAAQTESEKALKAFQKEARARARANDMFMKEMGMNTRKQEREQTKAAERLAARAERLAASARTAQEREARSIQSAQDNQVARFAQRTSHRFSRFLAPNLPIASLAKRTAADFMRGVGVDMSVAGSVSRAANLDESARNLSNQGWIEGDKLNGRKVSSTDLIDDARRVADEQKIAPDEVISAMGAYVKRSGDLKGVRGILSDMAELAGATGTKLDEMALAAAVTSKALDPAGTMLEKDRQTQTMAFLRVLSAQGKIGAVEMEDQAKRLPMLTASAGKFGGDRMKVLTELAALTQISMDASATPAQAFTSMSRIGTTLTTPARIAEFNAAIGKDKTQQVLFDEKGDLKDPMAIIKASVIAAGTGPESQAKLHKMWANILGAKGPEVVASAYRQAGGGAAGEAAVDAVLSKYMKSNALSPEATKIMNEDRKAGMKAKGQDFQNNLDKIVSVSAKELVPAFQELAPLALSAAKALGGVVAWAAANPGKAVLAGFAVAGMRAAAESAIRASVEQGILALAGKWSNRGGAARALEQGLLPGESAPGVAGGGPGPKSRGFMGRPTAGAVAASIGTGLMIGAAVASDIYASGTSSFDRTSKDSAAVSRNLAGVQGKDLGLALVEAQTKRDEIVANTSFWEPLLDLFGGGSSAEIAGLDNIIAEKKTAYSHYQAGTETPDEKLARLTYENDQRDKKKADSAATADAIGKASGAAFVQGLAGQTLNVNVRSLPPGASQLSVPTGREPG